MEWMSIAVGLIFLICFVVGLFRGAIKIAVSLVTTVVTLILVVVLSPFVAKAVRNFTPMDDLIINQVSGTIRKAAGESLVAGAGKGMSREEILQILESSGVSEDELELYGMTVEDIANGDVTEEQMDALGLDKRQVSPKASETETETETETVTGTELPRDLQMVTIENAELPSVFKNLLSVNNNNEIYKELGVATFSEYVGNFLAVLIINILSFLAVFIIATIFIRAVVFALDVVAELPGVGFINRLGGGIIGLFSGLVIVWTLFVIITLLYVTPIGKEAYDAILDNNILKTIYEYNPIMRLAAKI